MSASNAARVTVDPVAQALANASDDEREVTEAEVEALRAARVDARPLVPGAPVTASIAQRAQEEE